MPVTSPPLAVGSRISFVANFLGRRLAYTYEVRELVPGEWLVMSTSRGPFPMGRMPQRRGPPSRPIQTLRRPPLCSPCFAGGRR